jgi:hypothetical protein
MICSMNPRRRGGYAISGTVASKYSDEDGEAIVPAGLGNILRIDEP